MADDIAHLPLAGEFEPTSHAEWMQRVDAVLARSLPDVDPAEAFERLLVHHTEDGIRIPPLYTADDVATAPGLPGFVPFTRSARVAPGPWEIRQRVGAENTSAITELEGGATGILLDVRDAAEIEPALNDVYLDLVPVSLTGGSGAHARTLLDLWDRRGVDTDSRRGTLGLDPFGDWLRSGGDFDLDAGLDDAATVIGDAASRAPRARVLVADGTVWHGAGATDAQELAWTMAVAVATVRALVGPGVPPARAFDVIEFRWAATADQFGTIAKLRAARRLWSRIASVTDLASAHGAMYQHADVSRVMLTRHDPWVNVLRSTVAAFAAGVGGADAITVPPHDLRVGASALGGRIARNTQLILQEEAHLARVIDPAGGSWYVESFTDELAAAAWALLRTTEAQGGIVGAVESGAIHEALAGVRSSRDRDIATRRRPITGVSEFPDLSEDPPPEHPADVQPTSDTPFPAFTVHHWSDGFDEQRLRADRHLRRTGVRPTVFLATLGDPSDFTARVDFARNLYATGGIVTVVGEPPALATANTPVACLCSSDTRYRQDGASAVATLRERGAELLHIAGRADGLDVDHEIRVGADALAIVADTLDALGVAR